MTFLVHTAPVLTSRRGALRDWILFAAAALAPGLAMGALALRAISNEDAGVRREAALALSAAAQQTSLELDRAAARGARELEAARLDADPGKAGAALRAIAPPFAEPVVIGADRSLVIPAPSRKAEAPPPARCAGLVADLASPERAEERAAAKRELLAGCAEAKTSEGRWIWPLLALEALGRGEGDPEALARWLEAHAGLLGEAERTATLLEVRAQGALSGGPRERALAALGPSGSRREALAAALRGEDVRAALRSIAGASVSTFRAGAAAGALRADDGRLAGFVVHAGSLADAIATGALALPPGVRAQVVEGAASPRGRGAAGEAASGERLEATVEIAPALALRLSPADPAAVARRASRSRSILAGIGAGATALAFLLAAALFARMRAARRLGALRTDFVAAVSHELRTPIASVRMLAELLEEGRVEPAEQREVIEALSKEAKRLGETVDRLLRFSRLEAGRSDPSRAPARLAEVVAASIDAFEERGAGAPLVLRELDGEAVASVDAGQVRLAVDNLLENARKHAPGGGPYRVRVERDRGGVAIRVADRGPGIERRHQRRIFEPFERADDRLSQATQGSGIGLSLVRHVARAHGGRASVDSEPGKGATFTLWIPGGSAR